MATFQELAKSLYPNMPIDILDLFADEWAKTGAELYFRTKDYDCGTS